MAQDAFRSMQNFVPNIDNLQEMDPEAVNMMAMQIIQQYGGSVMQQQ